MKITIESTDKMVELNGVQTRVWEGRTDAGVPMHCYIARVAVAEGLRPEDYQQFERELRETRKPTAEVAAIPARMTL